MRIYYFTTGVIITFKSLKHKSQMTKEKLTNQETGNCFGVSNRVKVIYILSETQ